MSEKYQWSQEDHTPEIDGLANELGAEQEYRAELNRRLQAFIGSDWENPTAKAICKDLDECDATIRELEQAIKEAQNDYIKTRI